MEQKLPELSTAEEAAAFLRTEPRTLANWRCSGKGPSFVKLGERMIRYPRAGLLRFAGFSDGADAGPKVAA
jgi:hypothetical protein